MVEFKLQALNRTQYMAALRKRLGNAGVDLSNPKVNESFVLVRILLPLCLLSLIFPADRNSIALIRKDER